MKRWTLPICARCEGIIGYRLDGGCTCDPAHTKTGTSIEFIALSEIREALLGEAEKLERPPTDIASGSTTHAIRVAKAQGIRDAVAAVLPSTDSEGKR